MGIDQAGLSGWALFRQVSLDGHCSGRSLWMTVHRRRRRRRFLYFHYYYSPFLPSPSHDTESNALSDLSKTILVCQLKL